MLEARLYLELEFAAAPEDEHDDEDESEAGEASGVSSRSEGGSSVADGSYAADETGAGLVAGLSSGQAQLVSYSVI